MTRFMSSTFALARPKVPSYRGSAVLPKTEVDRGFPTFFLASLRARLSLLLRSSSMMRRS